MVAHQLGCTAKEFIWVGGDVHIYENHVDQVREQIKKPILKSPTISFNNKPKDLFSYNFEDFEVNNYVHNDYVPAEVSPQGQPGKGVFLNKC
jgi:thymidylate synthase